MSTKSRNKPKKRKDETIIKAPHSDDFKTTKSRPLAPHTQRNRAKKPTMKFMEGVRTVIEERRSKKGKF